MDGLPTACLSLAMDGMVTNPYCFKLTFISAFLFSLSLSLGNNQTTFNDGRTNATRIDRYRAISSTQARRKADHEESQRPPSHPPRKNLQRKKYIRFDWCCRTIGKQAWKQRTHIPSWLYVRRLINWLIDCAAFNVLDWTCWLLVRLIDEWTDLCDLFIYRMPCFDHECQLNFHHLSAMDYPSGLTNNKTIQQSNYSPNNSDSNCGRITPTRVQFSPPALRDVDDDEVGGLPPLPSTRRAP